jgi:hypothetical protein
MEQTQRGELIQLRDILHWHTTTSIKAGKTKVPLAGGHSVPTLGVGPPSTLRRSPWANQSQEKYTPNLAALAINPDTGKHTEYNELSISSNGDRLKLGMAKELGRLFQGYQSTIPEHMVQGTDTCPFITPQDTPLNKKAAYVRIVAELREQKLDPYRVRCTVGGNQIAFPEGTITKVTEMVTIKCLINNIISITNAKAACIDLKDSTSTMSFPHQSMSSRRRTWYQKNSSNNNIHTKLWQQQMATSIPKSLKGCMDYPRQERLQVMHYYHAYRKPDKHLQAES